VPSTCHTRDRQPPAGPCCLTWRIMPWSWEGKSDLTSFCLRMSIFTQLGLRLLRACCQVAGAAPPHSLAHLQSPASRAVRRTAAQRV